VGGGLFAKLADLRRATLKAVRVPRRGLSCDRTRNSPRPFILLAGRDTGPNARLDVRRGDKSAAVDYMAELIYEKFRTYDWDEDEAFKVWIIPLRMNMLTNSQTGVQKVLELKHMDIGSPEAQGLKDQYKFYYFTKYPL